MFKWYKTNRGPKFKLWYSFSDKIWQTLQPSKLPISPKEFEILFLEEASGDRQTHAHTTLDLLLEVRKHLGNSILEGSGKCLPEFKNSSKTLEWEMMTLVSADPIPGPMLVNKGSWNFGQTRASLETYWYCCWVSIWIQMGPDRRFALQKNGCLLGVGVVRIWGNEEGTHSTWQSSRA